MQMNPIRIINLSPDVILTGEVKYSAQNMGEKTIEITAQIDYQGDDTLFENDFEIEYEGEKYIMPLKEPSASKDNEAFDATSELTFQHWAIYQLKRYYFTTIQPTDTGTAIADKYIASVSLNLRDFCDLFSQVLQRNYGDKIKIDLNSAIAATNTKVQSIEINYTHIWDVLTKIYKLFDVRWSIEAATDNDNDTTDGERYVIKVGYSANELEHIFQYGFDGGLLKIERQVQDDGLYNILLGRGGEDNLPYRYFKDIDENNPDFRADPDWIPELANIYFDALRDYNFRCYVQGWKTNPKRQLKDLSGNDIVDKTTQKKIAVENYDVTRGETDWAYRKGHTDAKFDPVEYVKDDESIAKYGELWNGLENADDIYPTIQGISVDPYGRIDQAVDVEQVVNDDYEEAAKSAAQIVNLSDPKSVTISKLAATKEATATIVSNGTFTVPQGKIANLDLTPSILWVIERLGDGVEELYGKFFGWEARKQTGAEIASRASIRNYVTKVYSSADGSEHTSGGLTEGTWYYHCEVTVVNLLSDKAIDLEIGINNANLTITDASTTPWGNTFDVWIKNIWNSAKLPYETDEEYSLRVWKPILGDRTGSEARMMFTSGMLSLSDDYEFVITKYPEYDTSKSLDGVASHWRITLAKSDADLESTGLYLPNTKRQGKAGDYFVFIGTEMTHDYTLWAEKRLRDYKTEMLKDTANIKPTWVVTTDKVRMMQEDENNLTLFEQIKEGDILRLRDKRFISAAYEVLYISSVTKTYNLDDSLLPDLEIVLSDSYSNTTSTIATLSGDVEQIQKRLGALGNTEQIVRAIGDRIYLRKDGISDLSISPTQFASLLTSDDFRKGSIDGLGWAMYKDANNNWVFETDKIITRQELKVNTLVVNQMKASGGVVIESAASMEIYQVEKVGDDYKCYFDQHNGSVSNLFEVGDVAYCTRFDSENNTTKTYKRKVITIGLDYITLSGNISNGTGIPNRGDVIIQYGNYTNAERQYVKVRDVIGGGYERYLEGLNSVNAVGTEYFYVGRQIGAYNGKSRFFIGNKDGQYLEMLDGKITTNCTLEVTSKIGDKSLTDFVTDNAPYIGENMLCNSAFTDGSNMWTSYGNIASVITDESKKHNGYNSVLLSTSGNTEDKYFGMSQFGWYTPDTLLVEPNEQYTASVWVMCEDVSEIDYAAAFVTGCSTADHTTTGSFYAQFKSLLVNNTWVRIEKTFTAPENAKWAYLQIYLQRNGKIYISQPKIEKGAKATAWSANNHDTIDPISNVGYLTKALQQSTTISGGLVLSSLIQVGEQTTDGYVVRAGMNGIWDGTSTITLWAGGEMIDADKSEFSTNAAKFLVRADGTAYAASNTVRFGDNTMEIGDNVILDDNGIRLQDNTSGDTLLRITNTSIGDDITSENTSSISLNLTKSVTINYKYVQTSGSTSIALMEGGYLKDTTLATIDIGSEALSVGSSISAVLTLDFAMSDAIVGGSIIARLRRDGKLIKDFVMQIVQTTSGQYRATCAISEIVGTEGVYALTIATTASVNPTSGFVERSATATLTSKGYARYGEAPGNNIGNDGVRFTWGTTTLLTKSGNIVMRSGDYGLKITDAGIYKFDKTSRTWVKIEL